MSRLFREGRYEALKDVIVSKERAAEIERQHEGVHLPAYVSHGVDEGKRRTFIICSGQGVKLSDGRFGVVQQELNRTDDLGVDYALVKTKNGNELVLRSELHQIDEDKREEEQKPQQPSKWRVVTETGYCPRCKKNTSQQAVDVDGDIRTWCQKASCRVETLMVWKSREKMAREYPDSKIWSKYAAKKGGVTSPKEAQ
jgi:hypothetical protein